MAKQRRLAVPAAVMHLAKRRSQAKSQATPPARVPANCPPEVKLLVQQAAKPQLLEAQD
jgi:hypothetical protein